MRLKAEIVYFSKKKKFKRCFYEIWAPNVQNFQEFKEILWNLLEIWGPIFTKAPLEKEVFFCFEKYTISAFKRTSIRAFWTVRTK